uniref:Uncharacterized protein n=1 Tax=Xiphophorus couchianus TaxID=32473 RepID=A0A3B5LNS4_9TELE
SSSSEVGAIWQDIEEGLREQAARLRSDLTLSLQENRELKERLMVSEATVHAQAEQLKDYRDLSVIRLRKLLSLFTQRFTSNLRASLPLLRKYNSLIQAQARELSHLRQRMREGQGVCHILTQHLGDTTKVLQLPIGTGVTAKEK